ncbi:MAG: radical SAM protein [Pirellulaceae bacterium]|nr:radical SAM protein [Planctomycetales bacterium]
MKIVFIRPNLFEGRSSDAFEPLVFAILRGLTPPEIECELYDERIEPIPLDCSADLIAITVETFTARRAYQISSHFRRRGIPVVLGGYHATFCPQEALRFASSVVVGDAEEAWPQVVADARHGRLMPIYRGSNNVSLEGMRVDRSIFGGKRYRDVAMIQFGRGCKYACDFCSIHAFYGTSLRWRPVNDVIREMAETHRRYVFITDDNLFNNRQQLAELLVAMRELRVHWSCQTSIDVAADEQLVRQMADSGCISVMVGFESLDPANLQLMKKSWQQRYGTYDSLIQVFRDHGIMVYGGFVMGYDHDTPDVFQSTLDFAMRNRLFLANFNPLAPTPGSMLYRRLQQEGRLIRDPWWLDPQFRYGDIMFQPTGMSPEQLRDGCYWARTQFNRIASIARRAGDLRANCRSPLHAAAFFLANWTSRREIHRKQGRPLGDQNQRLLEEIGALPVDEELRWAEA